MSRAVGGAVLVVLVLAAGCGLPVQNAATPNASSRSTATTTTAPTPTTTPTAIPTETPTSGAGQLAPPGVTERGVENATALLETHTATLNWTGHVSVGRANTTVSRGGIVVNATSIGRAAVAPGSDRYYEVVRTTAGPVNRTVEMYGNGSVEFRRTGGSIVTRPLRDTRVLASADLLGPYLRGGAYDVTGVDDRGDPALIVLRANRSDNASAVLNALPRNAEAVRSFEATVVVDEVGRVRSLDAEVGFVIAGRNRTHDFSFELVRTEFDDVERPAWVPTANGSDETDDGQSGGGATATATDEGSSDEGSSDEQVSDEQVSDEQVSDEQVSDRGAGGEVSAGAGDRGTPDASARVVRVDAWTATLART